MTIIQMQYYKTVCQYMSLTKAARELHVSQPALSMAIREMEDKCGVALFHHTANSLSITDHGKVLLDEITTIVNQYQCLQQLLSNNLLDRKYIRVGISTVNGNSVFPEIISRLRKKHPDIQLIISEDGTQRHYEKLDDNKVDLIIAEKNPQLSQKEWEGSRIYGHITLKQSDTVFAVSTQNPLAKQAEVGWAEIVKEPLVMLNETDHLTRTICREIKQAGYDVPSGVYYTSQMYTVVRFIEKNAAAGFLPSQAIAENPRIVGVKCPLPQNNWVYLVYRKDRNLFHSGKQFIQTAREVFPNHA